MKIIFEITSITLIGFLSAFFIMPYIAEFSIKNKIIDNPSERRINKKAIPRAGGLGICFGFIVTLVFLLSLPEVIDYNKQEYSLKLFLLALLTITIVGFIDDLLGTKPKIKLAGQIVASIILYLGNVQFGDNFGLSLPFYLNISISIFWLILITNAFNLIDGIDGLATGVAIIAALGIGGTLFHQGQYLETLMLCGLIGSSVGFLRYNYHPAKVFLGDSGSLFLGFTLAAFSLLIGKEANSLFALWVPVLSLIIPILDTALAVWRRFAKKIIKFVFSEEISHGGVMSADLEHLHHRLLSTGRDMRHATATLIFTSCLVVLFALLTSHFINEYKILIFSFSALIILYYIYKTATIEIWDSGRAIVYLLEHKKRPNVARATFLFLDSITFLFALLIVFHLTELNLSSTEINKKFFALAPKIYLSFACFISLSEFHSRHWKTKIRNRYLLLSLALLTSLTLSFCYLSKELSNNPKILFTQGLLLFFLSFSAIYFTRIIPTFLRHLMMQRVLKGKEPSQRQENILVLGSGLELDNFIKNKDFILPEMAFSRLAGIISDDQDIKYPCPIFALNDSCDTISEIIEQLAINRIIIASEISIKIQKELLNLSKTGTRNLKLDNLCKYP